MRRARRNTARRPQQAHRGGTRLDLRSGVRARDGAVRAGTWNCRLRVAAAAYRPDYCTAALLHYCITFEINLITKMEPMQRAAIRAQSRLRSLLVSFGRDEKSHAPREVGSGSEIRRYMTGMYVQDIQNAADMNPK